MKRKLLRSSAFVRVARRIVRRQSFFAEGIQAALEQMEEDIFQPRLRTHKLKGKLAGSWACSVLREGCFLNGELLEEGKAVRY